MPNSQTIRDWYKILNWKKLPNFGACHTLDNIDDFFSDYFESLEIQKLQTNILETLTNNTISQIRLTGSPGIGKTTFLYFLFNKLKKNSDVINKYYFYIFHANKANSVDEFELLTQKQILRALEKYYNICGMKDEYIDMVSQSTSIRDKINTLREYYVDNKKQFKKKLVVALDDVDMLTDDMAYNIAYVLKTNLETNSIIKWLVIRPTTFYNYSNRTKTFFREFFPTGYDFKENNLFDIIEKRIFSANGENAKNPFSRESCNLIQKLFDNNIRMSLPFLKTILEENPPKKIDSSTHEEFIQNYIHKSMISLFIKRGEIPNLHDKAYNPIKFYPLAIDIVNIINLTEIKSDIFAVIKKIARSFRGNKITSSEKIFQLRDNQIEACLQILIDKDIIIKKENRYLLNNKADIIANNISLNYYNEKCIELLGTDVDKTYLQALKVNLEDKYDDLVMDLNTW